jgi:hypothetical protein
MELHHYSPSGTAFYFSTTETSAMKTVTSIIGEGAKEMRMQSNANKQEVTFFLDKS